MPSQIRPWWNDKKIAWYERASRFSDFHLSIAKIIMEKINHGDSIIEVGTGLGHVTQIIAENGYGIEGYDLDENAISVAKKRSNLDIFYKADCYNLQEKADIVLALFFGRITESDNFKKLSQLGKKQFIYITGGGSKRHTSNEEIKKFLKERNLAYSITETTIAFNQPLLSLEEAEDFLSAYYTEPIRAIKRKNIKESRNNDFPFVLENNKEISIFNILLEDRK